MNIYNAITYNDKYGITTQDCQSSNAANGNTDSDAMLTHNSDSGSHGNQHGMSNHGTSISIRSGE